MSKGNSGLFKGTSRSTAHVWNDITATQNNYTNTVLPVSFSIQTTVGNYWVHGNATKHMYEELSSGRGSHAQDPGLYTQLMLADFQASVNKAISSGIKYGKTVREGNWELNIVKPRKGRKYPVIKHARFIGKEKK